MVAGSRPQAASARARISGPTGAALLLAAPAVASLGVFFVLPVSAALLLSVTDFDIYALANVHNLRFVGLANYVEVLGDPRFWQAVRNTIYFTVVAGPLSLAASLGAALLLDARVARARPLFRTIFFLPVVTTLVAMAVVWRALYHPRYGLLNYALSFAGIAPIDWLGDPNWAMPAIILMAIWKNFGSNMVIFLAGLQTIPLHLYEAAALDGANRRQQFRYVTLPGLKPTFLLTGVLTLVGYLQLFAEPYVMTQGGPAGRTRSLVFLMYEQGFRYWNLGRAAAIAFLLFAFVAAATAVGARWQRDADSKPATGPS